MIYKISKFTQKFQLPVLVAVLGVPFVDLSPRADGGKSGLSMLQQPNRFISLNGLSTMQKKRGRLLDSPFFFAGHNLSRQSLSI